MNGQRKIDFSHLTVEEQRYIFMHTLLRDTKLYTELRALSPEHNRRMFFNFDNRVMIQGFVNFWNATHNIFFVPNLGDGRDGKKHNIKQVTCFFCDFDVVKDYSGDYEKVLSIINAFDYEPSALVHSGRGLHTYWFLTQPLVVGDLIELFQWEGIQVGLAKHLGSDPSVSDINNSMRLPGTMNIKDKNNPLPCHVLWMTPNRYPIDEFNKFYKPTETYFEGTYDEIDDEIIRETAEILAELGFVDSWENGNEELKCFCPFHVEGQNPNLRFNIVKGVYHCWSCEASGNAYKLKNELVDIQLRDYIKTNNK